MSKTFRTILKIAVYAVGTCRIDRGMPACLEETKKSKTKASMRAAGIERQGQLIFAQSVDDSRPFLFLSSFHDSDIMTKLRTIDWVS